jgi:hypothetical protein
LNKLSLFISIINIQKKSKALKITDSSRKIRKRKFEYFPTAFYQNKEQNK